MRLLGLGPATLRRSSAPSHRVPALVGRREAFTCAILTCAVFVSACNVGHTTPRLLDDAESSEATSAASASNDAGAESDAGVSSHAGTTGDTTSDVAVGPPCDDGAYRCAAASRTEREQCQGGRWVAAATCGAGRVCEAANATTANCVVLPRECDGGPCETCNAGPVGCEYLGGAEDVAVTCIDGTPRRSNCRDAAPHCVNELGCKACSQAAHCTAQPPECYEYTCTEDFSCELVSMAAGAPCTAGVCNSAHECVECIGPSDCGEPATCREFTCDSGSCVEGLVSPRSSCTSDHGNLCNEAGECVACLTDNDCPSDVPDCLRAHCTAGGECEPEPKDLGEACGTDAKDVCNGVGVCQQCVNQSHCDGEAVCHDAKCISAYRDVGWFEPSGGAATAFAGFVYLRRLEPLAYPATVWSVGAIAQATTTTAIDIAVYADNGDGTWPEGAALTLQRLEGLPEAYQSTPTSSHPMLEAGEYHWLGFRVSDDVNLRLADVPVLTYDTGRRVQSGDFGSNFYIANEGDAPGGDSIEAYSVFVIIKYTE